MPHIENAKDVMEGDYLVNEKETVTEVKEIGNRVAGTERVLLTLTSGTTLALRPNDEVGVL